MVALGSITLLFEFFHKHVNFVNKGSFIQIKQQAIVTQNIKAKAFWTSIVSRIANNCSKKEKRRLKTALRKQQNW
jgi:hypothetical protein